MSALSATPYALAVHVAPPSFPGLIASVLLSLPDNMPSVKFQRGGRLHREDGGESLSTRGEPAEPASPLKIMWDGFQCSGLSAWGKAFPRLFSLG